MTQFLLGLLLGLLISAGIALYLHIKKGPDKQ